MHMSQKPTFPHQILEVVVWLQKDTGLRMAVSKDIPGFSLAAQSEEEMDEKLDAGIEEFIAFSGYKPVKVLRNSPEQIGGDFTSPMFTFSLEPLAA